MVGEASEQIAMLDVATMQRQLSQAIDDFVDEMVQLVAEVETASKDQREDVQDSLGPSSLPQVLRTFLAPSPMPANSNGYPVDRSPGQAESESHLAFFIALVTVWIVFSDPFAPRTEERET